MLHEVPDTLLEKEGIAIGAIDQEPADRGELGRASEERVEERVRARRGQGVDVNLVVARLARPSMAPFRPIAHEDEHPRQRRALHEGVEHGLRLVVQPVRVLDREAERSLAPAAGHEIPRGVERAPPPLTRVEGGPARVVDGQIEEREDGRQEARRLVRGQDLREPRPRGGRIVARTDGEGGPEQLDDGQIGRALGVRRRARAQHDPPAQMVRAQELPHESRLAHAGLADDAHDLATPCARARGASASAAISGSRPANGVRPRARAMSSRERGARQPRELVHGRRGRRGP